VEVGQLKINEYEQVKSFVSIENVAPTSLASSFKYNSVSSGCAPLCQDGLVRFINRVLSQEQMS